MPSSRSQHVKNLLKKHGVKEATRTASRQCADQINNINTITKKNYRSFSGDKAFEVSSNVSYLSSLTFLRTQISGDPDEFLITLPRKQQDQITKTYLHWLSLKLKRPARDHTKIRAYQSLAFMLKYVSADRLCEIFDLYAECLTNPRGKFRSKKSYRLTLWEFIKWDDYTFSLVQTSPLFDEGDWSMFVVIARRSREEFYEQFFYGTTDANPEVTKVIIELWKPRLGPRAIDHNVKATFHRTAVRFAQFWQENKRNLVIHNLSRTDKRKPEKVAKYLLSEFMRANPKYKFYYMNTDKFFSINLPDFLTDRGILRSESDRQVLQSIRQQRRRPTTAIGTITPSWQQ